MTRRLIAAALLDSASARFGLFAKPAASGDIRPAPLLRFHSVMKILCETSSLLHNIREEEERAALKQLREKIPIFGSELLRYEAANTPNESKRDSTARSQRMSLIAESEALGLVPNEKKLLGFSHSSDRYRGWFVCPLISDVPDEAIRNEIMKDGHLKQRDAEHVTLAICNKFDVLLTRDKKILRLSNWLEERFKLRAWLPSQLLEFLEANGDSPQ